MGCGDSSLAHEAYMPSHASSNIEKTLPSQIVNKPKTLQQQLAKLTEMNDKRRKLTQQEISQVYDKVNGNLEKVFDQLSERISEYYMGLTVETINLMSQYKFTQVETKVYLSEQFLLLSLSILRVIGMKTNYQYPENLFAIFSKAQGMLIGYLHSKYPRAGNVFVSSELAKTFKSFDMVDSPENDILRNANICFSDASDQGIIRKLKEFFNLLIDQIDTNFPVFQTLMQQRVFSYEFEGKRKFFNYKIGRKLPQNTSRYQLDEVDELTVSSPELFRVIIKWLQSLQEYLISPQEQINKKQTFKIYSISREIKDKIIFDDISPDQYQNLANLLKTKLKELNEPYKKSINALLKEMDLFNLNLVKILFTTERKQKYVPKNEAQVIKYAMYNTKLVAWILTQKLISVLKNLISVTNEMQKSQISSRVDLIKFSVSDLLRSMVIGTKSELMKVYENLKQLEKEGQIKIIKIKNRLGTPLNDAMIIFKIKSSFLICQLQLVLSEGQGVPEKVKAMEVMNHFLYELVRSPYGVLSQVAVLLGYKDNKINYEDKITFENKSFQDFKLCEQNHPQKITHEKIQRKPFICSQCTEFYHPFQNIFGLKRCEKCFIFQCCKCTFNKNKDLQDNQVNQRFSEQLAIDISGEKGRKTIFNTLTKQIGIQEVLKCFYPKKIYLRSLLSHQHYQKIKPKDIHSYIKHKNFEIEELASESQPHFLIVQFKGENTFIKCYFWNYYIEEIQNSFNSQENFYGLQKISSSYYDFITFFDCRNIISFEPSKLQNKFKLCLKPLTQLQKVKTFKTVKIPQQIKDFEAMLVIRIQTSKTTTIEGIDLAQQEISMKKQFAYASLADARKELPAVRSISQIFQMKNEGIMTTHLKYFETCPEKQMIKTLNLSNNKITDITIILSECSNVENLIFSKNFIINVKVKKPLKNLSKLILAHNKIEIFEGFENLPALTKLNVEENKIKKLQKLNLKQLNQFRSSTNNYQNLDWLQQSNLPELEYLLLESCGISNYGSSKNYTFNFPKLKKFHFTQNSMNELTLKCPQLKYVDVSYCNLSALKVQSQQIEILNINVNALKNLEAIIKSKFPNMRKFQADSAGTIEVLPVINAFYMEELTLSSCGITDVNKLEICTLPKLQILNISYNKFSKLPQLNFPNLKTFSVEGIEFKDISKFGSFQLPLIEDLALSGESSTTVQIFPLFKFFSLKTLYLNNFQVDKMDQFALSQFPNLQNVTFSAIKMNHFPKMTFSKATTFTFNYCQINNVSGLQESSFPMAQTLSFYSLNVGMQAPQSKLKKMNCPKLKTLEVTYTYSIVLENFLTATVMPEIQRISLNQTEFKSLPVINFPNLKEFFICNSKLQNIDNLSQSKVQKLADLSLTSNQISKLPKLSLSELKTLNLCINKINKLDQFKESKLPNLQLLNLENNQLEEFPGFEFKNLKDLNIGQNPLLNLKGFAMSKIENLENFILSSCKTLTHKIFPILDLKNVKYIDISDCNLTSIENLQHSNLPNLEQISIRALEITALPILKLPNLQSFSAYSNYSSYEESTAQTISLNDISNLSKWQCPKLQKIVISNSKISKLPVMNFPKLQNLELDYNTLMDTTNLEYSNLPELRMISLRQNTQLKTISIGEKYVLQSITYSQCKLEEINYPLKFRAKNIYMDSCEIKKIGQLNLNNTEILNLESNQIQDITACLKEATELTDLYISNNKITKFPEAVLPSLVNLYASNNQITEISFKQKNFPQLVTVNLSNNQLTTISEIECPNLQTLNLQGNQLTNVNFFKKDSAMKLVEFQCQDNQIEKVNWIPQSSYVYFSQNKLTDLNWIPNSKLDTCLYLFLEGNNISDISGLLNKNTKLSTLNYMILNENKIKTFPNKINLPSLQYLYMNQNQIEVLDNVADQNYPNLYILQLNNNKIKQVGPNFTINKLSTLDLSYNELTQIKGLNCKILTDINVSNNKIKTLNWVTKINCPILVNFKANYNEIQILLKLNHFKQLKSVELEGNILKNVKEFLDNPPPYKDQLNFTYNIKPELSIEEKTFMKENIEKVIKYAQCRNEQLMGQAVDEEKNAPQQNNEISNQLENIGQDQGLLNDGEGDQDE